MRRRTLNKSFLRRWMFGGSILVGMASFVACSSESGGGDSGDGGDDNSCTADVSSDPRNCGRCGEVCAAGESCIGGDCRTTCSPPASTQCGQMCADITSNALHCGGCNMPCQNGELCVNSACMMGECMNGTTLCAGACVNTQLDNQNCGTCGNRCLQNQACTAGVCTGGGGTGGTGGTAGNAGSGATGGSTAGMGGNGGSTAGMGGASGNGAGMGGNGGSAAGMGGTGGSAAGTGGTAGATSGACRVWMAKNGSDSNPGTEASPVATLLKAYDLMCPKPPDGTENGAECLGPAPRSICVKTGEYAMTERLEFRKTRMGTASNRLILQGDPALPLAQRPIFNFSGQTRLGCGENPDNIGGLTVNASYVTVKNLVVRNANDTCILVQGTQDLVENVLTHNCADTGIQISSGGEFTGSGTNNTIRNCDSHSNYDSQCDGENADGFAIKEGTGAGNVFTGCRSWNNTDDGFDLYAWTTPVTIENSWAFDQSRSTEDTGSDGNGFKLGGNNVSAAHILRGLVAVGNANGSNGDGFTPNSNPASLSCSNGCYAWGNTRNVMTGVSGVSTTMQGNATVTNMAADSARNADGSLKAIGSL